MPSGAITLEQVAARIDVLSRCDRAGRYPLTTLIGHYGLGLAIPTLLRAI